MKTSLTSHSGVLFVFLVLWFDDLLRLLGILGANWSAATWLGPGVPFTAAYGHYGPEGGGPGGRGPLGCTLGALSGIGTTGLGSLHPYPSSGPGCFCFPRGASPGDAGCASPGDEG